MFGTCILYRNIGSKLVGEARTSRALSRFGLGGPASRLSTVLVLASRSRRASLRCRLEQSALPPAVHCCCLLTAPNSHPGRLLSTSGKGIGRLQGPSQPPRIRASPSGVDDKALRDRHAWLPAKTFTLPALHSAVPRLAVYLRLRPG